MVTAPLTAAGAVVGATGAVVAAAAGVGCVAGAGAPVGLATAAGGGAVGDEVGAGVHAAAVSPPSRTRNARRVGCCRIEDCVCDMLHLLAIRVWSSPRLLNGRGG